MTETYLKNMFNVTHGSDALLLCYLAAEKTSIELLISGSVFIDIKNKQPWKDTLKEQTQFVQDLYEKSNSLLKFYIRVYIETVSGGMNKNTKNNFISLLLNRSSEDLSDKDEYSPLLRNFKHTDNTRNILVVSIGSSLHYDDEIRGIRKDDILKENIDLIRYTEKDKILSTLLDDLITFPEREYSIIKNIMKKVISSNNDITSTVKLAVENFDKSKTTEQDINSLKKEIKNQQLIDEENKKKIIELRKELESRDLEIKSLQESVENKDKIINTYNETIILLQEANEETEDKVELDIKELTIVGCKPLTIIGGTLYFSKKIKDFSILYNLDIRHIDNISKLNIDDNSTRTIVFNALGTPHSLLFKLNAKYKNKVDIQIVATRRVDFLREYLIYE